jgi:hypothetical protein
VSSLIDVAPTSSYKFNKDLTLIAETVNQKLEFAKNRLTAFEALISNNELSTDPNVRPKIIQEFFFHLHGATEYLAQLVNERLSLGLNSDHLALHKIVKKLSKQGKSNSLVSELQCLCADTKRNPLPQTAYSNSGLIYRMVNYRNEVVHKAMNPFHFVLSEPNTAYFWLDPRRNHSLGKSEEVVDVELKAMYELVKTKCQKSLTILN